jgi:hypothetical protein
LCPLHYQQFYVAWKKACIENGSLSETSKPVLPELPRWQWKGDEDSLARFYGKNDELPSEVNGDKGVS